MNKHYQLVIRNWSQNRFGSDYPVHMGFLKQAVAMMEKLDVGEGVKAKIWGENAARLFRLDSTD